MPKVVSQLRFVKGLVSTTNDQSQPKGSLPRLSNLLYTRRGGLKTCDGSLIISLFNGSLQFGSGPWTELFLFQPVNVSRYYIGVKKELTAHLGAPTGNVAIDAGAGGTLAGGTYRYVITSLDGAGGESTVSNEASVTIANNHLIGISWNPVNFVGNGGYRIYRTVVNGAPGSETLIATLGSTGTSFQDNGGFPNTGTLPPAFDTTQTCQFYRIPATSYSFANIIQTFPADPFVPQDGTPGGTGGGGGVAPGQAPSGNPPTALGGFTGNLSPLPQIVQFVGKAVLALGNGFAPQLFTDPNIIGAITNSFTATYPDWQTATAYNIGDIIKPSANNAGNFIFKATQGGISGGAAPTFPQTQNQQVADNKIIWQNIGIGNTAPAPRGAAHAVVYAGSLWVLNTSPTTTTDNLDGPNALKMSDINNPTSWNPLNVAFLSKDDGDQGTGLLAFTIADVGIVSTSALFAFKNFKTFQIIGVFGSSNFQILEVQTDMGCIAPRSISYVPGFGGMRLTHLGVAVLDGLRDKLISEDIRPYLFDEPNTPDILALDWNYAYLSKAAQFANPPMYVLAVPIALNPITGVNVTTTASGGATFAGLHFFRVSKITTTGETAVSVEFTQTIANNIAVVITIPSDTTAISYRIYHGSLTGAYTAYATVANTGGTFNITNVSFFTTSGNLNYGFGQLTRLLCYDLVFKCWAIIDLPFAISVLKQVRAPGTQPITIVGGYNDASVRRIQAGDLDFDGTPIQWQLRTPKIYGDGGSRRVYYRNLNIRGIGNATAIAIVPNYNNGTPATAGPPVIYTLGNNGFHVTSDLLTTALDADATISGSGVMEIDSIDWEVDELPTGAPLVFG